MCENSPNLVALIPRHKEASIFVVNWQTGERERKWEKSWIIDFFFFIAKTALTGDVSPR
jgi:hypothetical protein